jgi:hypothetical protein
MVSCTYLSDIDRIFWDVARMGLSASAVTKFFAEILDPSVIKPYITSPLVVHYIQADLCL